MNFMSSKQNRAISILSFLLVLFLGFPALSHGENQDKTVLASQIIDGDLYDAKKELIGEVDDIIIKRNGRVKKLTAEFGGFLDIGDKLVAVNFKRFRFENGKIVIDMTEQQLARKSEFDYYDRGLLSGYYYPPRLYPGGFPRRQLYLYTVYAPEAAIENPGMVYSPSRYLASVAMDRRLINEDGQEIGQVKDFVIDVEKKEITKIILTSIRLLGEEVHVAIPFKPLGFAADGIVYKKLPGILKDYIYPYKK